MAVSILIDTNKWNDFWNNSESAFAGFQAILDTPNPFDDECRIVFGAPDASSIIFTLNKTDADGWCGQAHFLHNDLKLKFDGISITSDEKDMKIKNLDANMELPDIDSYIENIIPAIAVVYYLNNYNTNYCSIARSERKRLEKNASYVKGDKFRVLELGKQKQYSCDSEGGSGKKRYHLRRGHYHHYHTSNGIIKKWVKPCWCGDEDLGVINKSYAI